MKAASTKNGKGKVVEMAALKEEDEIEFDNESGEEEDEDSDEEESDEEDGGKKSKAAEEPEEYEMSLARANKVLEGSAFADLATSKVCFPTSFRFESAVLTSFAL